MPRHIEPERHGVSTYRYIEFGCRCEPCVQYYRAYQRKWRANAKYYIPPHEVGRKQWYDYGCRCASCTDANTTYRRDLKRRKREAQA